MPGSPFDDENGKDETAKWPWEDNDGQKEKGGFAENAPFQNVIGEHGSKEENGQRNESIFSQGGTPEAKGNPEQRGKKEEDLPEATLGEFLDAPSGESLFSLVPPYEADEEEYASPSLSGEEFLDQSLPLSGQKEENIFGKSPSGDNRSGDNRSGDDHFGHDLPEDNFPENESLFERDLPSFAGPEDYNEQNQKPARASGPRSLTDEINEATRRSGQQESPRQVSPFSQNDPSFYPSSEEIQKRERIRKASLQIDAKEKRRTADDTPIGEGYPKDTSAALAARMFEIATSKAGYLASLDVLEDMIVETVDTNVSEVENRSDFQEKTSVEKLSAMIDRAKKRIFARQRIRKKRWLSKRNLIPVSRWIERRNYPGYLSRSAKRIIAQRRFGFDATVTCPYDNENPRLGGTPSLKGGYFSEVPDRYIPDGFEPERGFVGALIEETKMSEKRAASLFDVDLFFLRRVASPGPVFEHDFERKIDPAKLSTSFRSRREYSLAHLLDYKEVFEAGRLPGEPSQKTEDKWNEKYERGRVYMAAFCRAYRSLQIGMYAEYYECGVPYAWPSPPPEDPKANRKKRDREEAARDALSGSRHESVKRRHAANRYARMFRHSPIEEINVLRRERPLSPSYLNMEGDSPGENSPGRYLHSYEGDPSPESDVHTLLPLVHFSKEFTGQRHVPDNSHHATVRALLKRGMVEIKDSDYARITPRFWNLLCFHYPESIYPY